MKTLIKSGAVALLVLTAIAILYVTTSTTDEPAIEPLSTSELKEWTNRNDTIFRNNKTVAIFEHYEYELNPNHRRPQIQPEICFIQVDDEPENTMDLVRYIHTIHSTSKIQIEFKDQYDRIRLWGKKID